MLKNQILNLVLFCSLNFASSFEEVWAVAQQKKMWEKSDWLLLLHMEPGCSACESSLDGGLFFMDSAGRKNPQAEMKKNLQLILSQEWKTARGGGDSLVYTFAGRFPARYFWLAKHLDLPPYQSQKGVDAFLKWKAKLKAQNFSIIYASAFLNNPASVMGHSFLKINSAQNSSGSEMLDYAVSYGANTPVGLDPFYPVKGVFGAYRGSFQMLPYYLTLIQYAHIEHRDVWEYPLHLSQGEKERLLAHLWELGGAYADYFFFDENCSEKIFRALEVTFSQEKTGSFGGIVYPLEVLRELNSLGKLEVEKVKYRPSIEKQLLYGFQWLDAEEKRVFEEFKGEENLTRLNALEPLQRARVLDLYLQWKENELRLTEDVEARGSFQKALQERLKLPPRETALPPNPKHSPLESHKESYAGLGASTKRIFYGEGALLRHHFGESEKGRIPGQEIRFFDGVVRWEKQKGVEVAPSYLLRLFNAPLVEEQTKGAWLLGVPYAYQNKTHQGWIEGGFGGSLQSLFLHQYSLAYLRAGKETEWGASFGILYGAGSVFEWGSLTNDFLLLTKQNEWENFRWQNQLKGQVFWSQNWQSELKWEITEVDQELIFSTGVFF